MFITLLALSFMTDIIPIKVNPGDPIPDISVKSFDGSLETQLSSIVSTGYCVFLSPTCEVCKEGIQNTETMFDDENIIYLFIGELEDVKSFLGPLYGKIGNAFLADVKDLQTYDIVTFPAVIAFKEDKCRVAMHGPLHSGNIERLKRIFSKGSSRITKK